jgi:hypothetical protein
MSDVCQLQIIDKLVEVLKRIKIASGYRTDVMEVNKKEVSFENIKKFPAINIIVGQEDYLNPPVSEAGRLTKTLNVVLDAYIDTKADKQTKISNLIADIELLLYDDTVRALNVFNLEGKCFMLLPVRNTPFNLDSTDIQCGFEHELQVKYRQSRKDPTLLYG